MNIDLWVEKYRPDTLDGYVFKNEDMKAQIESWLENKEGKAIPFPNLLLSGSPGSGKTTLSQIICNIFNVNKSDILTINASRENNVETVREKIIGFCSTFPIGNYKVVRLEECLWEEEEVKTLNGSIRLKDMKDNTEYPVMSFDMDTGKIEEDIATVISRKVDEVFEVTLEDGRIINATVNHPFLIEHDGKVVEKKLEDLNEGDEIISEGDVHPTLIKIKAIRTIGERPVVNLNVKKNHTFITKNGIITHNCDHMSHTAQAILRAEVENFSDAVRFIITCNYPNRIIPAIHSRFQSYHFDKIDQEGFIVRLIDILEKEGIEYDPDDIAAFYEAAYPDLRKGINLLEQHTRNKKLHSLTEKSDSADYILDMVELFKQNKFKEARTLICSQVQPEEYESVYRYFYEHLDIFGNTDEKQTEAIIIIANGLRDHALVADPEINLSSTICKLIEVIKS